MKLSLSWLKDYVRISVPTEKLAEDLLLSGTKVESLEHQNSETILEFEITPNRPDCLAALGIAREISAIYQQSLILPEVFSQTETIAPKDKAVFSVHEKQLCPYYSLAIISNIQIGPSPKWLVSRLASADVRSVNNVVDVTNFVMLETGQPMHAFDFDKVDGKMTLRAAKQGEQMETLDGTSRKLPKGALVIEDESQLIDLAGIMGGASSQIDSKTNKIILLVPVYDSLAIRRTSQALGLRTEASNRFEKQLSPNTHRFALERALELLKVIAQGTLTSKIISTNYPQPERTITVPLTLFKQVLGQEIETDKVKSTLSYLGFSSKQQTAQTGPSLVISIPSHRTDIRLPIDLTEEIGRFYGYNNFRKVLPQGPIPSEIISDQSEINLKRTLAIFGAKEAYTSTLLAATEIDDAAFSVEDCLRISNRLVVDFEYLRPSLLIGLLKSASLNTNNFEKFTLFEIGRIFEKSISREGLPNQPKKIAVLLVNSNLSESKGMLEALLARLNIKQFKISTEMGQPIFATGGEIFIDKEVVGTIGKVRGHVLDKFGINLPTFAFELDLEGLFKSSGKTVFEPLPKYPVVKEEFSLFVPEKLTYGLILQALQKAAGDNYYSSQLLEDSTIQDKHSVLIGVSYFAKNRTLQSSEIAKIHQSISNGLEKIGCVVRTS